MLQTFLQEERGDITQHVIFAALLAVVLAFVAPWLKGKIKSTQTTSDGNLSHATSAIA